jgi:hypothetical protein
MSRMFKNKLTRFAVRFRCEANAIRADSGLLSARIAFASHQRALLVEIITLAPAGLCVYDRWMIRLHLLSYQFDAVPFR